MWNKNSRVYKNKNAQEVSLWFRSTQSSDWKYQDIIYERIYEVKLETKWGVRQFWYCFPESSFPTDETCILYLKSESLPFEPIESYLQNDISKGLDLGAIFPQITSSVLVFGRACEE